MDSLFDGPSQSSFLHNGLRSLDISPPALEDDLHPLRTLPDTISPSSVLDGEIFIKEQPTQGVLDIRTMH